MNKKCALLTIEDLSNFESYDDLLIEPFNQLGWECIFVPWDSKSVCWDAFDAVIIRSTWDYQQKEELFFKTLVKISKSKAKLYNPLSVVKWNINKKYLKDLEERNIAIIPTKFFDIFELSTFLKNLSLDNLFIFYPSLRYFLSAKIAGIKKIYNYPLFSKKNLHLVKAEKEFTEKCLNLNDCPTETKIYVDKNKNGNSKS